MRPKSFPYARSERASDGNQRGSGELQGSGFGLREPGLDNEQGGRSR